MSFTKIMGIAAAATLGFTAAQAGTLEDVQARGTVVCGVSTALAGFATPDDDGKWVGLDVDVCRAVAAATLGDATKVEFVPTTTKTRFDALSSGKIDLLARNTTWTFSRDIDLKLTFVGVNYYDGQGFIGRKSLGVSSAKELDGASICVQTGTTTELNLADFFRVNDMSYETIPIETNSEAISAYEAGRCDVYTTDASGLAATRVGLSNPSAHIVYPEIISKEPLGPLVRHGDDHWADVVRWTLNAMITAEELGINSNNVATLAKSSNNPEISRLLSTSGNLATMIGLNSKWAYNIIAQVGNYAESFERNVGKNTPLGLSRGLNAQWTNGGLLYSPPFR